ncbi:MAG: tetratricopeptide repeat protein [Candidatus Odinarchaeia archaeon]
MNTDELFKQFNQHLQKEEYIKIINSYNNIEDKDILDYRHYRILAISYLNTFNYNEALKAFEKCIELYPKIEERDYLIVEPLYLFAHKLLKNRQYDEFEKTRRLLLRFNKDYYFFRNLERKRNFFQQLDKKGYFDQAITILNYITEGEKYLRLDSERELNRDNWEEICFDRLQRAKEMASDIDLIWELLGIYFMLLLNFEESEKHLKKAYVMNLGCETIRFNIGLLNEKRGFYEDAIKFYKEALEIDPEYEIAIKHIALCQSKILYDEAIELERKNKLGEALEKLSQCIKLNPKDDKVVKKINLINKKILALKINNVRKLLENRNLSEAEEELKRLSVKHPKNEEIKGLSKQLEKFKEENAEIQRLKEQFKTNIKNTEILISILENIRNASQSLDEKYNLIQKLMLNLTPEIQEIIVKKLSEITKTDKNQIEEFDRLICETIDFIGLTNNLFIPLKINTQGRPVDSWLAMEINHKIRKLIENYPYWRKEIPIRITYNKISNQIISEDEKIKTSGLMLLNKEVKNYLNYQIWLLKDKKFLLLLTDKIISSRPIEDPSVKVYQRVFKHKIVDFHNEVIQIHRFEINHILSELLKQI